MAAIPAITSLIPAAAVIVVLPPEGISTTKDIVARIKPTVAVANPITAEVLPVESNSSAAPVRPPNREPIAAPPAPNWSDLSAAATTALAIGSGSPAFFKTTSVTITPVPIATFVITADRSTPSPNSPAV